MTKNKKAAARIANYFGYDKVSDYIDFLDKKAGVQSTAKPVEKKATFVFPTGKTKF
jgi:hypothetical protein